MITRVSIPIKTPVSNGEDQEINTMSIEEDKEEFQVVNEFK